VAVVTTEKNSFSESSKAIKTVRISKFICQRVSDCPASAIKRPTAVRARLQQRTVLQWHYSE